MSDRRKLQLSLIVATLSGLAILNGAFVLYGSMGNPASIALGSWQLGSGFLFFSVSAPLVPYFRAKSTADTRAKDEIIAILEKSKQKDN